MHFAELVDKHKPALVDRWITYIVETYPPETARFLKSQKNRFTNPVGVTLQSEVEHLLDQVAQGLEAEQAAKFLDNIIRVRAVQDFTPTQAVGFVFALKPMLRERLEAPAREAGQEAELRRLEDRVDQLALMAFDIYAACREQIYKIRADELKRNAHMMFRRAGLVAEAAEPSPQDEETNGQT